MLKVLVKPEIYFPINVPPLDELYTLSKIPGRPPTYTENEYSCLFSPNKNTLYAARIEDINLGKKYVDCFNILFQHNFNDNYWSYLKFDIVKKVIVEHYHFNTVTKRHMWSRTIKLKHPVKFKDQDINYLYFHSQTGFHIVIQTFDKCNIYISMNDQLPFIGYQQNDYLLSSVQDFLINVPSEITVPVENFLNENYLNFKILIDDVMIVIIDGVCNLIDRE